MIQASDIVVDRDSNEPLYQQIKNCIVENIRNGKWRPNEKLPSYKDLVEGTCVSLITIQLSVGALVKEGVLCRKRGVGVFTAPPAAITHTNEIGLLLPDLRHPFFSSLAHLVQTYGARHKHTVAIFSLSGSQEEMVHTADLLEHQTWDGIITSHAIVERLPSQFFTLNEQCKPIVFVDGSAPDGGYDYVETDNEIAMDQVLSYLTSLGHQRIGFAAGPLTKGVRERIGCFRAALVRHGLLDTTTLLQIGAELDEQAGEHAGNTLLSLREPPTAIVCANDVVAAGVINASKALGMSCPRDVSVVGFDDILVARHLDPPLTTVHQPLEAIAESAVNLLLERIQWGSEDEHPPRAVLLPPKLVIRESVAAPSK